MAYLIRSVDELKKELHGAVGRARKLRDEPTAKKPDKAHYTGQVAAYNHALDLVDALLAHLADVTTV